jgi:hypothetical protein
MAVALRGGDSDNPQRARRGAMLSTHQLAFNQHFAAVVDGKLVSVIL